MSDAAHMRDFWDARAREHAAYFVDNRLDYNHADEAWFWDQGARDLDEALRVVDARVVPGQHVLDVGCGVGRLARALVARGARVEGIDVSPEMVARARANVPEAVVHLGDGTSLRPLRDASFDGVVSLVVFQHVPDPAVTLGYAREVGRVLRPGGWAVLHVSDDPDVHARGAHPPAGRLARLLGRAPRGQDDPAWRGSAVAEADLRRAVGDAGCTVDALRGAGTQFRVVRLGKPA